MLKSRKQKAESRKQNRRVEKQKEAVIKNNDLFFLWAVVVNKRILNIV